MMPKMWTFQINLHNADVGTIWSWSVMISSGMHLSEIMSIATSLDCLDHNTELTFFMLKFL